MGITNLLFIPTWVPILVFVGLLLSAITYGALGGWKRAAYWGGSAIVWLFIGWIIFACAKNAIANLIISKIGSKFGDFDVHSVMMYAFTSVLSILFYLIIILIGTVFVSVPLYYGLFRRRILHIYSRKYAEMNKIKLQERSIKYKLFNALIGASGMTILFLPLISDLTSITMVVSTDYHVLNYNGPNDLWTNKKGRPSKSTQGFLKGINNLSKLPFYNNDALMFTTTLNGIFELMSQPSELNDSVLNSYAGSVKNLLNFDAEGITNVIGATGQLIDKLIEDINGSPIDSISYNQSTEYAKIPLQNILINGHITNNVDELLSSLFEDEMSSTNNMETAVDLFAIATDSLDIHALTTTEWNALHNAIESQIADSADRDKIAAAYTGDSSETWNSLNDNVTKQGGYVSHNQIAWLKTAQSNGFVYGPLATETITNTTSGTNINVKIGVESVLPEPNTISLPCYIPNHGTAMISQIRMPSKALNKMSSIIKVGDNPTDRGAELAKQFVSYFYTDKNVNGQPWSLSDI